MTFNIGSQSGGIINNVAGDQHVTGGQQGTAVTLPDARQAMRELRSALATAPLDRATATEIRAQLDQADAELGVPQPDPGRVARCVERLTRLLIAAGPLATASATVVGSLQTIANWLASLGEPILRLLPLLR
jgi:hypothetical protein